MVQSGLPRSTTFLAGSPLRLGMQGEADEPVKLGVQETLRYLSPPAIVMGISLVLTWLVLASNPTSYQFTVPSLATLIDNLLVTAIIGLIGGVATGATFLIFRRGGEVLSRIVVAVFVSPVFFLLTVFLGETVLLLLFFGARNSLSLSIIAFVSIFFAAISVVFILSDVLGPTGRNFVFTLYGLILAVFLGTSFAWYSSLAVMGVLAAEDTLFAAKLGPTIVNADPHRQVRSAFAFVVGPMVIGIGDLVVAGALAAYSLRFFGWLIALLTAIAVLIGCFINVRLVARRPNRVIPGLPIPLLCALVPILLSLLRITLLALSLPIP
jgi:hypothetical protein